MHHSRYSEHFLIEQRSECPCLENGLVSTVLYGSSWDLQRGLVNQCETVTLYTMRKGYKINCAYADKLQITSRRFVRKDQWTA